MIIRPALVAACGFLVAATTVAAGPDVIVGFIDDAREDVRIGTIVGLTASTDACNIGDAPAGWHRLPDNRHPAITLNLYRLENGRFEHLAKSWVKHGFYATNQDNCLSLPELQGRNCQAGVSGAELRPGCSDFYGEDLNADPQNLGPRSRITNPTTGEFDGLLAKDLTGYPVPGSPNQAAAQRIMMIDEAELKRETARYFVEAQYIVPDDGRAGNSKNNVSFREVKPVLRQNAWTLKPVKPETTRRQPALFAWKEAGAQIAEIEQTEYGIKTYVYLGSRVAPVGPGKFRYEYVVYNLNSDRAVSGLRIPARGVDPTSIGFRSVASNGEIWSNEPWAAGVKDGVAVWSSKAFSDSQNANALRWGSAYNFWFESSTSPGTAEATVTPFKSGGSPVATRVIAPAP
jgi:hypothetical protein